MDKSSWLRWRAPTFKFLHEIASEVGMPLRHVEAAFEHLWCELAFPSDFSLLREGAVLGEDSERCLRSWLKEASDAELEALATHQEAVAVEADRRHP